MVKQANGWDALPYVWKGDDAYLSLTGTIRLTLADGKLLTIWCPAKINVPRATPRTIQPESCCPLA